MARVVLRSADMHQTSRTIVRCGAALLAFLGVVHAAAPGEQWQVALTNTSGLVLHGVQASVVTHNGHRAIRLVEEQGATAEGYAIVPGPALQDGTIEVDVAGRPGAGANEAARGFVGVAFRVKPDHSAFECFYLRPTNGRAEDQLRRNHSTQYISFPGFPWEKLRKETPGVYESYADLVPSEWTHVRVDFRDRRAQLYVNRAPQPVLIVNDLKQTPTSGGVALWIGTGTEGFFRDLRVTTTGS
jgi:hypothetical protein